MLLPVAMPARGSMGGGRGRWWEMEGGVEAVSLTVTSRLVLGSCISAEILQICQIVSMVSIHVHQQHTTGANEESEREREILA